MENYQSHFELSDHEFESAFASCTLAPALFTHEAHLRLAWIHVTKYGVNQAIDNICRQLLDFVDFADARSKYNKTLTTAAIKAVNHFVRRGQGSSFEEFIAHWPRLKYNFKELIACHYQKDIFNLPLARVEYLEPDLLPFD